ncbi:MAG: ATP-binding cassette domain-containing protein, partial [Candidatus Electrothrix sp. AR3]|nr:ATP-binding cassette domain-containing protein [Candidatus Electrothrix sp. AR3]
MLLACRDLSFVYPNSQLKILDKISFSLRKPGFNAIFGPSGVGKTSLARIIAGQIPPSQGKIQTQGINTILYSYNLERLPAWTSIGQHL